MSIGKTILGYWTVDFEVLYFYPLTPDPGLCSNPRGAREEKVELSVQLGSYAAKLLTLQMTTISGGSSSVWAKDPMI